MSGCAVLFPQTSRPVILAVLFVNGLCRSMQFTCLSTLAFADVPKSGLSSATSFFSMITQMSVGMGVAVGAILLRVAGVLEGNAHGNAKMKVFLIAFVFVAGLTLLATIDWLTLRLEACRGVGGHGSVMIC